MGRDKNGYWRYSTLVYNFPSISVGSRIINTMFNVSYCISVYNASLFFLLQTFHFKETGESTNQPAALQVQPDDPYDRTIPPLVDLDKGVHPWFRGRRKHYILMFCDFWIKTTELHNFCCCFASNGCEIFLLKKKWGKSETQIRYLLIN